MSYPTSIRGVGVGFAQTGNRVGGTIGLVVWPMLTAAYDLGALLFLAAIPLLGLASLLLIRWDPTHVDVDVDDYAEETGPSDTAPQAKQAVPTVPTPSAKDGS